MTKMDRPISGLSLSVLEDLLQESSPFLRMELYAFPDKVNFSHHIPDVNELLEFIRVHGCGFQTCPNDMSLKALAEYIHLNVASKIKIGTPSDASNRISCGFSSVFRSNNTCIHGGETSDRGKCIYVQTKSLDPIWSPKCNKCLGKSNPINFSGIFRVPQASKRGRLHEYIMKLLERALVKAL